MYLLRNKCIIIFFIKITCRLCNGYHYPERMSGHTHDIAIYMASAVFSALSFLINCITNYTSVLCIKVHYVELV